MDISLNITTAPQPMRSKPVERTPTVKTPKKKSNAAASNGFSFEFGGGGQKVKALVARKRPATTASSVTSTPAASAEKPKQSVALRRKSIAAIGRTATPDSPSIPKSLAIRRKSMGTLLKETKVPKAATPLKESNASKSETPLKQTNTPKSATPLKESNNPKSETPLKGPIVPKPATPLKQTNTPKAATPKSMAIRRKASATPKVTPKKIIQTRPYESDGDSDLEKYAKVPKQSFGDDLTLNICTTAAPARQQQAKMKMTRAERMNQKRAVRRGNGPLAKRVLSQREIDEGIKRFSENPNKKPRPGDLLDMEEKTEKMNIPPKDVVDEPEVGVVDPKARKSNAFRVKRPEDSSVKKINLFKNNPEAKVMGQRLVKPITERVFDGTKVESLSGLHLHSVKNLADILGITELTTVQKKTIPKALEGKDLLVRSQTGSGKTLAYALPIVEKLQEIRPKLTREAGILAVIIVPTRELAIQTYELFVKLLKPFTWIVPGVLMGGERRKAEKARLRKGINILVGTPGRLVDHLLHTESFKLSKAKFLVLDEADRLLEMGYERDVKQIVEAIDKQRQKEAEESKETVEHLQRLLLSATLTSAVQKLAGLTLREPIFIDNSDEDPEKAIKTTNGYSKEAIEAATAEAVDEDETGILTIPSNLQLSYVVVPPKLRLVTIAGLLAKEFVGKDKLKAMLFMSTMEMVNFHHDLLNEQLTRKVLDEDDEEAAKENEESDDDGEEPLLKGLRFFKLHGSMTQTERQGVFKGFRECKSGVLLATDVVGRGIDVPEVDLVIQYSPPQKTADFVHRVGRTARAGRSGRAVLFLAPSEAQFVRTLEDKRIRISQVDMDVYLKALNDADDEANTIQEAASNLQHKFQELVADDKELHDKACKAFVSWMKFYSTFPRELKPIFNIKNAHMGHFAKSFGLKDTPTSFTKKHSVPKPPPPTNRLTYTERDPEKLRQEKKQKKRLYTTTVSHERRNMNASHAPHAHGRPAFGNKLVKLLPTSCALTTSEFDSGLPALKKRKV